MFNKPSFPGSLNLELFCKGLTLSQTRPGFYVSAKFFWKHCGEKEELLVTSNFSFSHNVYNLFGELSAIFIKFLNILCKLLQFGNI